MRQEHPPDGGAPRDYRVNLFRPRPGYMRKEAICIWTMLAGWALATFGFQFWLALSQRNPSGVGPLTEASFLGFPFYYWFTGQFLVLFFILLCFLFNVFIDRLSETYRRH
ncbi:MAG: DUF4212 domain-containing protein [Desulfuromonas sp.]|uniref:DUF4212 domain-containing protein n=1 Tax=Desulfuromonas sp. TaxID=892 RepID=UPI000CA662DA|nr:sodium/substrate symporter small subunit [Desulfuromonas sp.]PLX86265.1 MAG: DUF4212 domain-containing protein [Desulfuromonas sp.]